jgi:hypothetical protein
VIRSIKVPQKGTSWIRPVVILAHSYGQLNTGGRVLSDFTVTRPNNLKQEWQRAQWRAPSLPLPQTKSPSSTDR